LAATQPPTQVPSAPTGTPSAVTCDGDSLTFELSFIPNVQHAGFLVAANRGYYEEEGLTVEIVPASQAGVTQDVADGTVQLGQVDYVDIVEARNEGVTVKAIAQTYKDPFFFWYAAADSGVDSPADFEAKRVGAIQIGDYPERDAMMLAADADPASITVVEQEFDGVLDDTMDIAEGVVFFHPAFINGTGVGSFPDDYNVFYPADNGADFASQTIAATDDYIASNSDTITCFLRASIRGWQDTFVDPAAAVADTMTFVPSGAIPEPHQQAAINDVLPIVGEDETDTTLLEPTPDEYQTTLDALVEVGYLTEVPPVEDTFDSGPYDAMGPIPIPSTAPSASP
jgi:NitT/TauT family transport system substrate-binding protein